MTKARDEVIGRRFRATKKRRRIGPTDLRRFAAAVRGSRRISACRAVVDGAVVVVTLRRRGVRPLLRRISTLPTAEADHAREIARAVDAGLGLLPVAPTCLRRSVVLLRELHRCGLGASLHVGVRRGPNGMQAHAWVQVADHVVNDDADVVAQYGQLPLSDTDGLPWKWT